MIITQNLPDNYINIYLYLKDYASVKVEF